MRMFHSIWTLSLLILFIAIIIWAWSSSRKKEFERAARMPLDDDQSTDTKRHG
ncbi:MAG: cbb3-type cytochrome c oxidase subunit 3 [Acidiferrobacterales bacterium]|nr:cbb3-type cytochrome c oxidase subunit 3 [Acidiferrobacterales bacterium]